ncbi:MAG: hypothetical protein ACI9U2_003708 [Bradymonadia bacterium]|jgi:hypothetical protein
MTPDELMRLFKFIYKAKGIKNSVFARWSVFACPFWQNAQGTQVGFKLLAYRGVDSSKMRVAKMACAHLVNCGVSALGAGATGLGAVGSGVGTVSGKFGGIKPAFGVDIGAIQLATVIEGHPTPNDMISAIINSGKLLQYAVVRVDKSSCGHTIYFRCDVRPNSYTEWGINNIGSLQDSSTRFSVFKNGIVFQGTTALGNYKTRLLA